MKKTGGEPKLDEILVQQMDPSKKEIVAPKVTGGYLLEIAQALPMGHSGSVQDFPS